MEYLIKSSPLFTDEREWLEKMYKIGNWECFSVARIGIETVYYFKRRSI
jgi:hypothetical protein